MEFTTIRVTVLNKRVFSKVHHRISRFMISDIALFLSKRVELWIVGKHCGTAPSRVSIITACAVKL